MRYFFSLTLPKTLLPYGVSLVTTVAALVSTLGFVLQFLTRCAGTVSTTIQLTPIAITANHHLPVASGTIEKSGTVTHRRGLMSAGFMPFQVRDFMGRANARFWA